MPGVEAGRRTGIPDADGLDVRLLGPVEAFRDGAALNLGGARAETLLALLALRAGSPVDAEGLIDELWIGDPPDGASTTLRSYVSRLRGALGAEASIDRVAAGYVLRASSESVDVARFEAFVREGREVLQRGRHRRAGQVLRSALDLWRGPPFAGLAVEGSLRAEAVRLQELRLHALESRIEADLAVGRAAELVDELEGLVAVHPFQERFWRHLMLALYHADRQADALAAYHRARTVLDDELGIEPGEELRALEAAILRQEVPRAAAASSHRSIGVPVQLTTFVGRTREMAEALDLLRRARLVTLVGVGGVGKTRLAIELARRANEDLVDAIGFVDLAALTDPSLLPGHVAASLGLRVEAGPELAGALAERAGSAETLLILDNCEHLREPTASLARTLLESSADLRILATSREVLDVAGEAAYPVPPLALTDAADDPEAIRGGEAVRLLVDRATLTRHDLKLDDAAYAMAARICSKLDGLPLAIELAAARTKALSLEEIADRLDDRFQFLVAWRRLTAARHRTLREAMDWSYNLLAPDEQRLLTRLSVFPAGARLASIAAVCLDDDEGEAERLIERLVDASLLVPVAIEQGTRYRLLETVRQYAAELLDTGELAELQRRHAEQMRVIAESANLSLESATHVSRFDLAREELPSIRAAIHWADGADPALGLEIACALERFLAIMHAREGIAIFSSLLAHDDIPEALRARGLRCRGGCRYNSGDFAGGVEDYEAALAIHRRLGQTAHEAHLLMRLAMEANRAGDRAKARQLLDELDATGDDRFEPDGYVSLGLQADLAFDGDRVDDGFELLRRAGDLAAAAGDTMWEIDALMHTAERALDRDRLDDAGRAGRAALRLAFEIEDRQSTVWCLATLAQVAATAGSHLHAARLWGGLEGEVERAGPVGQWELEAEGIRTAVAAIAGEAFQAGLAEGRSMSLQATVEAALAGP